MQRIRDTTFPRETNVVTHVDSLLLRCSVADVFRRIAANVISLVIRVVCRRSAGCIFAASPHCKGILAFRLDTHLITEKTAFTLV